MLGTPLAWKKHGQLMMGEAFGHKSGGRQGGSAPFWCGTCPLRVFLFCTIRGDAFPWPWYQTSPLLLTNAFL